MRFVIDIDPLAKKNPGQVKNSLGQTIRTFNPRQHYIDTVKRHIMHFWGVHEFDLAAPDYEPPFPKGVPIRLDVDFVMDRPKRLINKPNQKRGVIHPKGLIFHSDVKRQDMDNLLKPFKDAVNGILWKDDSQVCVLHGRKFYREVTGVPRISFHLQRLNFTPLYTCGEVHDRLKEKVAEDLLQMTNNDITAMPEAEVRAYLLSLVESLRGEAA